MSPSTDHAAQHDAQPPLASLLSLPRELQARIITLACLSTIPVRHIETKTTFSLMLVSRSIHALAAAQLYRNLHITRASVLLKLQRTFASRPALGQLVHSLHLGPDNHLPDHWWPMKYLMDTPGAELSLREMTTSLEDDVLLPRWCGPRRSWALNDEHAVGGRRDYYVLEAIEVAQMSLDVKLTQPRHNISSGHISSASWLIRVMEAQAALDLYLMEMRRIEDKAGYWVPRCDRERFSTQGPKDDEDEPLPFYPPLVIISRSPPYSAAASKPSDVSGEAFVLQRKQLVEHLIKPKAVTDYLDHPLFASRSGVEVLTFAPDGQANASEAFWPQMAKLVDGPSKPPMLPIPQKPEPLSLKIYKYRNSKRSGGSAHAPSATADGILMLAHSVLSAASRLRHLRLTGLLQLLLCGPGALPAMPSLRTLSLGPSSLCHTGSLSPSPAVLWSLEKLFLLGHELAAHKVAVIAALPKLKEVYWDLTHSDFEEWVSCSATAKKLQELVSYSLVLLHSSHSVLSAIKPLFNEASLAQPSAATRPERVRSSPAQKDKKSVGGSFSPQRNPPFVQISIDEDSEEAMRSALSPQALAAWDEHQLLSETPYRIEIVVVYRPRSDPGAQGWEVTSEEVFQAYWESENAFEYFLTGRWPWDCGPESQVA